MKKLLLILLCVPLIFSCGEKGKGNETENKEGIRSEILRNQEGRDSNNINNPCDCNDMQYSVYEDMINLADGRMKSDIEKNEKDNTLLISLYQENKDISNICEKMYQKLGEEDFYRNHSNCKYPNIRKLRIQLSKLGIAGVNESEKE